MGTGELNAGGGAFCSILSRGEVVLVTSCYRRRNKLRPDGPLGLYADFTFTLPVTRSPGEFQALNRIFTFSKLL